MSSIPIDLINEILSRLPLKSVGRFRCVSKQWGSMLHRPYFTELFLTRSQRLLLAVERSGIWRFFSWPQPQNPYEKLSTVVAADFHTNFPRGNMSILCSSSRRFSCGYAAGLIYFSSMYMSRLDRDTVPVICNPNTGQYAILPKLRRYRESYSFLGFDPIDKQFKVLFMAYPGCSDDNRILTVGTGKMRWRQIKCPLAHDPWSRKGVCIKGVLYYLAFKIDETPLIVCFDVRSEKFEFLREEGLHGWSIELIDYKGKLGLFYWKYVSYGNTLELCLWVVEDAEKHKCSKYVSTLQGFDFMCDLSVVGVTATGDIVLNKSFDNTCGDRVEEMRRSLE